MIFKIQSRFTTEELSQSPQLEQVFIRLNNICNAKCEFCDVWQTSKEQFNKKIPVLDFVEQLIEFPLTDVNLHGGESFLSKEFKQILLASKGRIPFSITTNGRCLTDENIEFIANNNVTRIYLSVDHFDETLNAKSRGIPWLEDNLHSAIRRIKTSHPQIILIINHVVSSYNIETIDKMCLTAKTLGADCINLIPMKDYNKLFVSIDQIEIFYKKIESLLREGLIKEGFFLGKFYKIFGNGLENWISSSKGEYNLASKRACIIPSNTMFIDAVSGDVYPCDTTMYRENHQQYIMGNIIEDRIKDIWDGEKYRKFRGEMFPEIRHHCVKGCDPANCIKQELA
ncbi:MAG: radical SAM protein [Oligoflexia bacterium]|nr:radical SAM protein [Oligoflexia bacterium]